MQNLLLFVMVVAGFVLCILFVTAILRAAARGMDTVLIRMDWMRFNAVDRAHIRTLTEPPASTKLFQLKQDRALVRMGNETQRIKSLQGLFYRAILTCLRTRHVLRPLLQVAHMNELDSVVAARQRQQHVVNVAKEALLLLNASPQTLNDPRLSSLQIGLEATLSVCGTCCELSRYKEAPRFCAVAKLHGLDLMAGAKEAQAKGVPPGIHEACPEAPFYDVRPEEYSVVG